MKFLISDSFTGSLSRLTGEEQKAAKTTAFDLQLNPVSAGHSFHKLDRARDKNFWSVRVNSDLRLIVHRTPGSLLLCYVDHHDSAYAWAGARKLETHPTTGAAQFVEIRETVQEIMIPALVDAPRPARHVLPLFIHLSDEELLRFGVPGEWLPEVRRANEDSILTLCDHLPAEAAEALLELATGGKPRPRPPLGPAHPFDHPDARRRFRIVTDVDELSIALDYPWEKWTTFLHPAQRELVERHFRGPARASGSAGTGKTIVAIHRAAFLARSHPDARLLLTTFSEPLASALRSRLGRLLSADPRTAERIDVEPLETVARRLYARTPGASALADPHLVRTVIQEAAAIANHPFSLHFLVTEWEEIVDAWQLESWEAYRDIARLGRKTCLPEKHRAILWEIFSRVHAELESRGLPTLTGMYHRLAAHLTARGHSPYDFVVVDEAQDVSVPQLRLLAALGGARPDSLFFAGDLGQRILQLPFSWKALGVDIRGRSSTLRVNYRTSHQIRAQADRLLGMTIADVDGNVEDRSGTVSVFNGPPPKVETLQSSGDETDLVKQWLADRTAEGVRPEEIGVFVRSEAQLERGQTAIEAAGLPVTVLDSAIGTDRNHVSLATMSLGKGLEFRAVVVMACDDEVLPLQSRIEAIVDESDLEEVYDTERHLLYVACTRARDHLLVTGVHPASEFLDDMRD